MFPGRLAAALLLTATIVQAPDPRPFAAPVISDANEQWRLTFTPDGRTAYFAESEQFFPFTRQAAIYVSEGGPGGWAEPRVAPFSGVHSDIDPVVSPDGQRIYFSSIRPVDGIARTDLDIWMVESRGRGWSAPIHLGPKVNGPDDELYPSVSADGTLYFASGPAAPQPGKHFDIYRAKKRGRGFAMRETLGPAVNAQPAVSDPDLQAAWDFNPEISRDGTLLLFTSLRPGGHGRGDLYVSRFVRGEWSAAENLGPPVNTGADEYHPTLSHDGKQLYFVRRGPRPGDFFTVAVSAVPALAGR